MSIEDINNYIKYNKFKIVGITGNAASGKTTLVNKLAKYGNYAPYSVDYRFIGDSEFRKQLLDFKSENISAYIDACNQYNWWNWDRVHEDIESFFEIGAVDLVNAYDRNSGNLSVTQTIVGDTLLIEGAILGPLSILKYINWIIYVGVSERKRLIRLLDKDIHKRSTTEIAARFLITEYSENLYYKNVLSKHYDKILFIDDEYHIAPQSVLQFWNHADQYIPMKVKS